MWHGEETILTTADPVRIWSIWADVPGWTSWNAGIEAIELHGPFVTGTTFTMKLPTGDVFESSLVNVDPTTGFTDETVLGDVRVTVHHSFERLPSGETRITYATDVTGPDAAAVGDSVTADFPEVLARLKKLAESP